MPDESEESDRPAESAESADPDPVALKHVGPATAAVLSEASFDADDVRGKSVSFRMLVDAGVNPGVAARIRREHSLSWSFESEDGDDLKRRSAQIRGLGDDERAWVAASSGDWEAAGEAATDDAADETPPAAVGSGDAAAEADGSGDPIAAESAWRERSRPTPVTALDGVDDEAGATLAEAGITSVRALAAVDPTAVADALGRDADWLRRLRDAADASL
ncbi:DUF7409 domain-containing protein [Candidatus Halobonum tyrrellensis]|uniref:DUF7409 domain-containing protein n=1 Tax=Candidatus Halobonum tyrrellensis G22 TaxID=1324957 RepID=V4HKV2_9EURY|nr:hypothetical protein [Candidatus Halobonum tyrrellensis]ESP88554.1 hypothetical protein K933_08842 [Candidatus Halobonum tyrrellensis G22]